MSISVSQEKGSRLSMFPRCKAAKGNKNAGKEMGKASKSVKALEKREKEGGGGEGREGE